MVADSKLSPRTHEVAGLALQSQELGLDPVVLLELRTDPGLRVPVHCLRERIDHGRRQRLPKSGEQLRLPPLGPVPGPVGADCRTLGGGEATPAVGAVAVRLAPFLRVKVCPIMRAPHTPQRRIPDRRRCE